jgi:hypothetical protein
MVHAPPGPRCMLRTCMAHWQPGAPSGLATGSERSHFPPRSAEGRAGCHLAWQPPGARSVEGRACRWHAERHRACLAAY